MTKEKRLSWFPVYGNIQKAVEEMSAESVKAALLSALVYVNDGELPLRGSLEGEGKTLFHILRQNIDDAEKDYKETAAKRAAAARARWEKEAKKK